MPPGSSSTPDSHIAARVAVQEFHAVLSGLTPLDVVVRADPRHEVVARAIAPGHGRRSPVARPGIHAHGGRRSAPNGVSTGASNRAPLPAEHHQAVALCVFRQAAEFRVRERKRTPARVLPVDLAITRRPTLHVTPPSCCWSAALPAGAVRAFRPTVIQAEIRAVLQTHDAAKVTQRKPLPAGNSFHVQPSSLTMAAWADRTANPRRIDPDAIFPEDRSCGRCSGSSAWRTRQACGRRVASRFCRRLRRAMAGLAAVVDAPHRESSLSSASSVSSGGDRRRASSAMTTCRCVSPTGQPPGASPRAATAWSGFVRRQAVLAAQRAHNCPQIRAWCPFRCVEFATYCLCYFHSIVPTGPPSGQCTRRAFQRRRYRLRRVAEPRLRKPRMASSPVLRRYRQRADLLAEPAGHHARLAVPQIIVHVREHFPAAE